MNGKNDKVKLKKSQKALEEFQEAILEIATAPKGTKKKTLLYEYIALLYLLRGEIFYKAGSYPGAMDAFTRAREVNKSAQQNHDAFIRDVFCTQRRALIFSRQDKLQEAEKEIQKAIAKTRQARDTKEEYDALEVAIEVYLKGQKKDLANATYNKLIKIVKRLKMKQEKPALYFDFAKFLVEYRPEEDQEKIADFLRKAATLFFVQKKLDQYRVVLEYAGELSTGEKPLLNYDEFFQAVKNST